MFWTFYVALLVVLDQVTKMLVVKNIPLGTEITVINNFFYISHYENNGMAWSMLQNGRIFLIIANIVISTIVCYLFYKYKDTFIRISLATILSGAFGNLADRIFRVRVVDFLEFHFGSYVYPIFNVADSLVAIGAGMMIIYLLCKGKEKTEKGEGHS